MIRTSVSMAFFLGLVVGLQAQPPELTDSLKQNLERATTAEKKVLWLGELSQYYMGVDNSLSNQYAAQQMRIAEESRDRNLMVTVHLYDAQRYLNFSGRQENINKGIESAERALALAHDNSLQELEAWAYDYLALGSRFNSDYDKALNYGNMALSLASGVDSDSLKVSTYNTIAKIYLAKDEKMLAFRNFLKAMEIAEASGNFWQLRSCYKSLAGFYRGIDDFEKAKDLLYKLIAASLQHNRKYERQEAYNELGEVYAGNKQYDLAQDYYDKALALADSLNFTVVKLNTYVYMINMYLGSNQWDKAIKFFDSKPELRNFMIHAGFTHFIYQAYGMAHTMMGNLDSGAYYLAKAEPTYEKSAPRENKYWFYSNMLTHYQRRKDYKKALAYGLKAEAMSESIGDLSMKSLISRSLDSLYQETGDYQKAYLYNHRYQTYKDSLEELSQEKELMALEIENERKRKEREAAIEAQAKRDWHNIQYMGITVAIAAVFIILVMLGIFSVSHTTIRILGFFAFIFLFEFIILIADNQIHHWTHGEPWKILAIKIGLISILLPLHHYLEEKVIHYLTTKKLLEINKEALLGKFISRKESEEA